MDNFELTLNHPISQDDMSMLTDEELEHTTKIWFSTPSGKKVEFIPMKTIDDIKNNIRKKQWHIGIDGVNIVMDIIDKHINS